MINAAKTRVCRGARWLDENFPGWEERIDLDSLQLTSAYKCICGQLFEKEGAALKPDVTGFNYAVNHLFAQANSWISETVGMKPVVGPIGYRYGVRNERSDRVAKALGFHDGACKIKRTKSDSYWVSYSALEQAWRDLLGERALIRGGITV
jgi:hypothetical protein